MSSQLASAAKEMVAPGKGVLAADESTGTANKRFAAIGVPETEEMRRDYRDMLFTAPGFSSMFSGVILYDETIRQNGRSGKSMVDILLGDGVMPGIKLDTGAMPLALAKPDEKVTEGLDGLAKRVDEYVKLGATFAKWRAVITIDAAHGMPTENCLHANAHALARYAAICQAGGLVPIVEPEVLSDGAHAEQSLELSYDVTSRALRAVFEELALANVDFKEMILKPSMIVPGQKAAKKASVREVAENTVDVLLNCVPASVAGIAFLSGGQEDEAATAHLNEINVIAKERSAPWPLTFSYGRALQHAAMHIWMGDNSKVGAAHAALVHRGTMNSLASLGQWSPAKEKEKEPALRR